MSKALVTLAVGALVALMASPLVMADTKERGIISGTAIVVDGDTIKFGEPRRKQRVVFRRNTSIK